MENKKPMALLSIADHVEIESQKGMVRIAFFTSRLDKTLLPNHIMKLSEVVLDNKTAKDVGDMLIKHSSKGVAEAQIKRTPLPDVLLPKSDSKN